MSTSTVTLLLLMMALAHAVPLGSSRTSDLTRILVLVQKILQSLDQIHGKTVTSPGLTFDPSSHTPELHLMMSQLQMPPTPVLKPISPSFTQEDCVRRMWEGLEQQQRIVGDLSSRLSALSDLHADLRDLQAQMTAMMLAMGVVNSPPAQSEGSILTRLHGDYETQVATHLTLKTLRAFCQDLRRSLRMLGSQTL
ncbi:colony stimulating factor 3 (granulocyte) b [Eucyclogobius newberryi]|uniref:colony stimulating factor 3 (granulocyte) b n=1 Tax=Eucyclogobius newberryi TaxID=166745 RepID=UPI003B5CA014